MVVICAMKWGLVLNMARLVHFGHLPDEIQYKYQAFKQVDMAYITTTKPGGKLRDVFTVGQKVYKEVGLEGEENKHFQGGTCGYLTREQDLDPHNEYEIQDEESFAHNPSITGVKAEASLIAVVYSLFLGMIVYHTIAPQEFPTLLIQTAKLASLPLFAVGTASIYAWVLSFYRIPLIEFPNF